MERVLSACNLVNDIETTSAYIAVHGSKADHYHYHYHDHHHLGFPGAVGHALASATAARFRVARCPSENRPEKTGRKMHIALQARAVLCHGRKEKMTREYDD